MALESATYVNDLVSTNPIATDVVAQGDDHVRLLKAVLKATLPNATRAEYFSRFVAKTSDYTVLAADQNKFFTVDCTGGNVALTLPTLGASNDGWAIHVLRIDASANTVTISGTINGETNLLLPEQWQGVRIFWSGSAWYAFGYQTIDETGLPIFASLSAENITLSALLDLSGSSTPAKLPRWTTAGRPGSPAAGQFGFNTSLGDLDWYTGGAWKQPGLPEGYLYGMEMSNGTDTANDINVTAGRCRDSTNVFDIVLSTKTGKQIDASFAAGNNAGMRSSSGLSDTTWHIFAIAKADGTADILAHDAVDPSAVLPADYLYFRRIGSIIRSTSNLQFTQRGDEFRLKTPVLDIDDTSFGTSAVTGTLASVPSGIVVEAFLNIAITDNPEAGASIYISALTDTDLSPSMTVAPGATAFLGANDASSFRLSGQGRVFTNTSQQFRYRSASAGTPQLLVSTLGWTDTRGR